MWMISLALASTAEIQDTQHPIAFGVRTGAWAGPYQAPLIGGQIKIRMADWVGVTGFSDHTLMVLGSQARHDHVIGFYGYFPKIMGGKRGYVSPIIGTCVDFRITTPMKERLPSANTMLFGMHGGLAAEVAIWHRMSFEATAEVFGYMGNAAKVEDWSASASNTFQVSGVGQVVAGINYAL